MESSGSSSDKARVLPSDIVPVPQLTTKPSTSKKGGRAAVVTSSPYTKVLQLQAEAKQIREELAGLKKRKKEEKAALKKAQTKAKGTQQVKKKLRKNAKGEEAGTSKSSPKRKATSKKTVNRKLNFSSEDDDSFLSDNSSVQLQSDSDSDDPDTECLFCNSKYSDDGSGEQWVQCMKCKRWAHELCGAEDANFTCPMCSKRTKNGFYIM